MSDWPILRESLLQGHLPDDQQALGLTDCNNTAALTEVAGLLCARGHHNVVTYSRKVFIPLTQHQ